MSEIEQFIAEQKITKTVIGYMNAVDTRRWNDVGTFFAEEIFLDYSSVRATNPPQTVRREDAVEKWRIKFEQEIAVQHQLSNLEVRVDGGEASCVGNNVAAHVMKNSNNEIVLWQIGVRLTWKLKRNEKLSWVITSVQAEYLWDRTEPFNAMNTHA
jgi:hypothetical protein